MGFKAKGKDYSAEALQNILRKKQQAAVDPRDPFAKALDGDYRHVVAPAEKGKK